MDSQFLKLIQKRGYKEIHIQLIPEQGETAQSFAEKIAQVLNNYDAKVIRASFFGRLKEQIHTINHISDKLQGIQFPYSWIEGDNCTNAFINGVYIYAISGLEVKYLKENNTIVGSYFQTDEAEFCFLGGLYSDPNLKPAKQTENILNSSENLLNQVGMSFENTIRTWFYLDDILDWYNEFNLARTSFFHHHNIFKKLVPASTGIGGKNQQGSKVCMDLTAIKPKNDQFSIEKVMSPLQCSAEEYGSAFSRAIMYSDSENISMSVSGTASINPEGITLHVNDLWKQIELSFAVVKGILDSRNFSIKDIVRANAYCSDKNFSKTFYKYIETNLPEISSFICSENKICREDLMFEIELDVIKKKI